MNFKKWLIFGLPVLFISLVSFLLFPSYSYVNKYSVKLETDDRLEAYIDSTIYFKLDANSTPESFIYYEFDQSQKLFRFLNISNTSIHSYDAVTKMQIEKMNLMKFGFSPNSKLQGFHFLNKDSLIVYDYSNAKLSLVSQSIGIRWSKSLFTLRGDIFDKVYPNVTQSSTLIYNDSLQYIYATGFMGDEGAFKSVDSKRKVLVEFDLNTKKLEYAIPYPAFYWGRNWAGASGFRQPFHTYNKRKNHLVISFLADHNLSVVNLTTLQSRNVFAGSREFDQIQSMEQAPLLFDFTSSKEKTDYYNQSNSYGPVVYDADNDVYHRIAKLANKKNDFERRYSIIVLDSLLNLKSECPFPNELVPFKSISTLTGIWYFNKAKSNSGEIVFSRVNFKKILI